MYRDYMIVDPTDLESDEIYLTKIFKGCLGAINNVTKNKYEAAINIDFKININDESNKSQKYTSDINDNRYKIEISQIIYKDIQSFYNHALNNVNCDYFSFLTGGNAYNDNDAKIIRSLILELSMKFIMFHELGHIYNGHLRYTTSDNISQYINKILRANKDYYMNKALKMNESKDINKELETEAVYDINKILEMNADDFSITRIISEYCHPNYLKYINNLLKNEIDYFSMARIAIEAIIVSLTVIGLGYNNLSDSEKYLPLRIRECIFLNNFIEAFDYYNNKLNDFYPEISCLKGYFYKLAVDAENLVNNFLNAVTKTQDYSIKNNTEVLNEEQETEYRRLLAMYNDVAKDLKSYAYMPEVLTFI